MYVFACISMYVCVILDKLNLKFIWKYKRPPLAKTDTKEGLTLLENVREQ